MPEPDRRSRQDEAESPSSANLLRGRLMQRALGTMLDRVPGSRHALPHLAALEAGLGQHGVTAIDRIGPRGLSKIHTQLRVLPLDPEDFTLQDLLARVQNALRRHAAEQVAALARNDEQTHQLSPFDPESTVIIVEASHSEFLEAMKRNGSAATAGG